MTGGLWLIQCNEGGAVADSIDLLLPALREVHQLPLSGFFLCAETTRVIKPRQRVPNHKLRELHGVDELDEGSPVFLRFLTRCSEGASSRI